VRRRTVPHTSITSPLPPTRRPASRACRSLTRRLYRGPSASGSDRPSRTAPQARRSHRPPPPKARLDECPSRRRRTGTSEAGSEQPRRDGRGLGIGFWRRPRLLHPGGYRVPCTATSTGQARTAVRRQPEERTTSVATRRPCSPRTSENPTQSGPGRRAARRPALRERPQRSPHQQDDYRRGGPPSPRPPRG
jgi:hypothetical protein